MRLHTLLPAKEEQRSDAVLTTDEDLTELTSQITVSYLSLG